MSLWVFILVFSAHCNEKFFSITETIEELLIADSVSKAKELVQLTIEKSQEDEDIQVLGEMVYWLGKIELLENNNTFPQANSLADSLLQITNSPNARFNLLLGLSKLYNEIGDPLLAYEKASIALGEAKKIKEYEPLATAYYYLGEYGLRAGNLNTFGENTRKAYSILCKHEDDTIQISARILNYMGALMYLTGKLDSASVYYQKALQQSEHMKPNAETRYYFPATIMSNMVLLKQTQNQYKEALKLMRESIKLYNQFLSTSPNHPLRFRCARNLSLAYRNLVSLYDQIGDYHHVMLVSELAYNHAINHLPSNVFEYFSAISLLAEANISTKDYSSAIELMEEAEKSLRQMKGENTLHWANLNSIYARVYYETNDYKKAVEYYERGINFYKKAQLDSRSNDRLFSEMNLALSYAKLKQTEKANQILTSLDLYLGKNSEINSRWHINLEITKARVYDILNDSMALLNLTEEFLTANKGNENDAVYVFLPEVLTLNAKVKYILNVEPDTAFLIKLERQVQKALSIIEERKRFSLFSNKTSFLIAENKKVFDLGKELNLELYKKTKSSKYLENLLEIHESAIYNRIRSRLGAKENMTTFDLAPDLLKRESELKNELNEKHESVVAFLSIKQKGESFLDSLKILAPRYYQIRYERIRVDLSQLKERVPEKTALIRYFFLEDQLYVYVLEGNSEILIPLNALGLDSKIQLISKNQADAEFVTNTLFELYQSLWKPIQHFIKNDNVIIIPDRELFNLSFELLTPEKIYTFKELYSKSLLSRFNISYNYSLLLIGANNRSVDYNNDLIAFVPEFNSSMKQNYRFAIRDSLDLDKSYLLLLPQPFSLDMIKKINRQVSGAYYVNEKASKQLFLNTANEHKIIHIGTHAESNNINPELSRLVFAKNISDTSIINNNYLYAYEIYNQNLNSKLAILTACETGKPTFHPGEGMISLAHAFNYAGSESILTSLWQIDEQSSTEVLTSFYKYLSQGLPKDMALKEAKLDYLKDAYGRKLNPEYWAGLILMGDASSIELSGSNTRVWWIISIIVFMLVTWWSLRTGRTVHVNENKRPN